MSGIPKVAVAGLDALLRRIGETVNALIDRAPLIGEDNEGLNADTLDDEEGTYYLDLGNATGSLADARLSSNVPLKNTSNIFTQTQHFTVSPNIALDTGAIIFSNTANDVTTGYVQGVAATAIRVVAQANIPIEFYTNNALRLTLGTDGGVTTSNASASEVGYKSAPRVTSSPAQGQCYAVSSGFTLNTGFAAGMGYSIYNDSASAITITQGTGLTLRLAGTTTTGNLTLAPRGLATFWANSTTEYVMSGAGLSA